ncbi:MAG: hypothetical protein HZC11_09465, partial [Nitrospirae bacterium]|nr:hypothetical protein [Nitrospirota bacterium]
MSSVDLSRKTLIGFGVAAAGRAASAGNIFTYTGDLDSEGQADSATVSGGGYTFCLSANQTDPTDIIIRFGTGWANCNSGTRPVNGRVIIRFTDESRTGIIQEYGDKDQNYIYDTDAPRFGVRRWTNSMDKQVDIIRDSPALTDAERESYFRLLLTSLSKVPPIDSQNPYLGDMMKEIVKYFSGQSNRYEDNKSYTQTPYSWANDPLKACRKTFALFVTTGTYLRQDKLSPLPSACSSLTYTDAFPTNTCYAYYTDLYTTDGAPPRQNISTYVVHFGEDTPNEAQLTYAANISNGKYLKVNDLSMFYTSLDSAMSDMMSNILSVPPASSVLSSGSSPSMLASTQGTGANLIQAYSYPLSPMISEGGIYSANIRWIGRLPSYWYYIDPFFTNSSMREDGTGDKVLNLNTNSGSDNIVELYYDSATGTTKAKRWTDTDGDGDKDGTLSDIAIEKVKYLWDAGMKLWERPFTMDTTNSNYRKIYTTTTGNSLTNFSTATTNITDLKPYLQAANNYEAEAIIRYIHGQDSPIYVGGNTFTYRSRTTAIDLNEDRDTEDTGETNVWKLGDVMNSSPKISSWVALNTYDQTYNDTTYKSYIDSANYKDRGMVFVGGNDGMLHAFKLGKLDVKWTGQGATEKAKLTGTDLGKEMWTFIPKNVLPYLKYIADPNYCHVYSVDLSPYLVDASINGNPGDTRDVNSWKTILIGGMRLGGACRNLGSTCTNCVKTPVADLGYSSYFALDVTDQNNPTLLWEFSNTELGFATTGPAIVRIGEAGKNGKWFAVFGSGPTGPINTTDHQFLAKSDQYLRLFVLNLKGPSSGSWTLNTDYWVKGTGIATAFAGSMLNSAADPNSDYQHDVVYVGYTKADGSTWTQGGIGRLVTKEDSNPGGWEWSIVRDNIGPVTASISRLLNTSTNKLWLYFGTGRYYFEQVTASDDPTTQRQLFGIKEPCFTSAGVFDLTPTSCTTVSGLTGLTDVTTNPLSPTIDPNSATFKGWYIDLDAYTSSLGAERVIAEPVAVSTRTVF